MSVFKAYDIRGIYGDDLTDELVEDIIKGYIAVFAPHCVVLGTDHRTSSPPIKKVILNTLLDNGVDVIDIGMCSSPMNYYANRKFKESHSIMITASHNPKEYNGFKFCDKDGLPIGLIHGLDRVRALVARQQLPKPPRKMGKLSHYSIFPEYKEYVESLSKVRKKHKVVFDVANSMGIFEMRALDGIFSVVGMYLETDGTFPNHIADPVRTETLDDLRDNVVQERALFGVAFDGDADRIGFIDEQGEIIPPEIMNIILALYMLKKYPRHAVVYDLVSTKAIAEYVREAGGYPVESPVGHTLVEELMHEHDAAFGGESSGHCFFRENHFSEFTAYPPLIVAEIIENEGKPLSQIWRRYEKYKKMNQMNIKVDDAHSIVEKFVTHFSDGKISRLDGIKIVYPTFWLCVRASNTEPLIRINFEADTQEIFTQKKKEILEIVHKREKKF